MPIIPAITIKNYEGQTSYDLFSLLLKERIIIISGEITDQLSEIITAELLYLEAEDQESPITIYINSPGGSVTAGMAVYDIMKSLKVEVKTIAFGLAASMGAFLLSSGTKGQRYAKIIQIGRRPVLSPKIFGPRIFPSNCCKIITKIKKASPCLGDTDKDITKMLGIAPINGPKYGIIFVRPTNILTITAYDEPILNNFIPKRHIIPMINESIVLPIINPLKMSFACLSAPYIDCTFFSKN